MRTSKTGQGLATAAARLVARAAFEDLPVQTLGVYTNADNHASRRVAAKLGAVLVELKPEADGSCVRCMSYDRRICRQALSPMIARESMAWQPEDTRMARATICGGHGHTRLPATRMGTRRERGASTTFTVNGGAAARPLDI